jgi:hypothetical protein
LLPLLTFLLWSSLLLRWRRLRQFPPCQNLPRRLSLRPSLFLLSHLFPQNQCLFLLQ